MSLVAVHAGVDVARVMVDELVYNGPGTYAECDGSAPKVVELFGLDALSACAGDLAFGVLWQEQAARYAQVCLQGFDQFAGTFTDAVRDGLAANPRRVPELAVWLVGWSARRGRFMAYEGSSPGFELVEVTGQLRVLPAPAGVQPTEAECALRRDLDRSELPDGEPCPPPGDDAGWAALARRVHRGRAEALDDTKVLMGGDVTLFELTRGRLERRVVHRFDGADRARMLRGTIHPSQQLGPCICGSGVRMLGCHLPEVFDQPCVCGSGRTFADCCRVAAPAAKVGRNEPCPCGSGRKHKKCCQPTYAAV